MGCATGVVKYFVFLANLVFALIGLALIVVGILFKLNITEVTRVIPDNFKIAPILSIIIGTIIFVTAFLGCCGAVKESPCMLTTYAIILLTIFIVQVAIGIYAFLQIKNENQLRTSITVNLDKTFRDSSHGAVEARDATQRWLHCCGVNAPDEYLVIPASCCAHESCPSINNPVFNEGCAPELYKFLVSKSQLIAGVAIGVAAAEVLGAIFGLCLSSSIRNHYRRHMYS